MRQYEAQPRRISWHERSYVDLNENYVHRARRDVASVLSSRSDNEGPEKDNDSSGNDLDSGNEPPKGGQNHDDANDDPDKDDPSPVSFQAASDIDVEAIYAAVKRATAKPVAEYDSGQGSKKVTIYEDFMSHEGDAKAMSFMADMDVDCDGAQVRFLSDSSEGEILMCSICSRYIQSCVSAQHFTSDYWIAIADDFHFIQSNDPSGQSQTSYGALDAAEVPFYVVPETFLGKKDGGFIRPNSLGAIICNGKMFYAIMGDTK